MAGPDTITYFNMAIEIADGLDEQWPDANTGAVLRGLRMERYGRVDSPASFLRCMADLIEPRKQRPAPKPVEPAPAPKAKAAKGRKKAA